MNLNNLPKTITKKTKRLGRGLGSGRGKTAGRGMKGQKARGKIPAAVVGAGLALYKKLPLRRGWSRRGGNRPRAPKPVIVRLSVLNAFDKNESVNLDNLIKSGLVDERETKTQGVKVLAHGKLEKALKIELPVSKKAKQVIEQAGGEVVT